MNLRLTLSLGSRASGGSSPAPTPSGTTFAYIAADGAWSPHYNAATAPTATYDAVNDRILYAYEAGEIGTLLQRKALAIEYKDGAFKTALIGDQVGLNGDDHGVPSIATHPTTGRAYAFYGSHTTTNGSTGQAFSVEATPGALDFQEQPLLANETGLANDGVTVVSASWSYPHPVFVGSDLLLYHSWTYDSFYSASIQKRVLSYRPATLDGNGIPTFGTRVDLIDCGDLDGIDGFGAGSRVYHGQRVVKDGEVYIPISITDSGDSVRRQPGVIVHNPATGTLRNVEGTFSTTTLPINYATYKANFAHKVQGAGDYSSTGALAFDNAGNLHHVYRVGTNPSSLTFYHRIWDGTTLSAEVSTGVTVDNEFDFMAISANGADGLEALYTQDPLAAYAREGEVWRKTWTPGGGWTSGSMILDDESGRPGRGRPMAVFGKSNAFVMAEKSSGTDGEPGDAFYGQHRCWLYIDGAFVSRTVQNPPAKTPWAGASVRAGTAAGAFVGYVPPAGNDDDPFLALSIVSDAGGQFALADDGRRQFPNIVTTATAPTEGAKTLTLRATNRFGLTTDFSVPVTVTAAGSFEPEDLTGTKTVFRVTDLTRVGTNTGGSFVQAREGDLAYRLTARNIATTSTSERIAAGSTTDLMRWLPHRQAGGRGYFEFDTERQIAAPYAGGLYQNNAAWLMAFCVRLDSAGTAATPTIVSNSSIGSAGRFALFFDRASGEWRFRVGTTTVALAGTVGVDQVVMIGQTSAGNVVLRVDDTETTASSFNTVTGGSGGSFFGIGTTTDTYFRGRFYSGVLVKNACPDATGRANLKTWLAAA